MMRVGLIGYGYWGPNLARNLIEAGFDLAYIVDRDTSRLALAERRHLPRGSVVTTTEESAVLRHPNLDAVVIATPISTHYDLALDALLDGKHVLITKPLADTRARAQRLVDIAEDAGVVLLVDHTFIYTGAVRALREIDAGRPLVFDSTRVNLGLFQQDADVIWDLAPHDFSIMLHVLGEKPSLVSAAGGDFVGSGHANMAWIHCEFESGAQAHIAVSWLSPVKVRRTVLTGTERVVVYDDLEPFEKLRIYEAGVTLEPSKKRAHELMVGYQRGDVMSPALDTTEALLVECEHFRECISGDCVPMTGGQHAVDVVELLEAASRSLAHGGMAVSVP